MTHLRLLSLLLCLGPVASGAQAADHAHCDEYMKKWGGPCMEGAPAESSKPSQGVLPKAHREVLGFTVGAGNFAEAKKALGSANEWHSGDAASSETKICYFSPDSKAPVTVVLAQNSEMSSRIDEIRLIQGQIDSRSECAQLGKAAQSIRTRSGLHVGMTEHQLRAILGEPTYAADGLLFYYWHKDRELKHSDPAYSACLVGERSHETLGSGITARVLNGAVVWLAISYGEFLC
jgi:hypothetical protein